LMVDISDDWLSSRKFKVDRSAKGLTLYQKVCKLSRTREIIKERNKWRNIN
jgi:hypothetical protein